MLIHFYRFNNWLYRHHVPLLPEFIWKLQYLLFNSTLPASSTLGKGTVLAYGGIGIAIHARAVIAVTASSARTPQSAGSLDGTKCP